MGTISHSPFFQALRYRVLARRCVYKSSRLLYTASEMEGQIECIE